MAKEQKNSYEEEKEIQLLSRLPSAITIVVAPTVNHQ